MYALLHRVRHDWVGRGHGWIDVLGDLNELEGRLGTRVCTTALTEERARLLLRFLLSPVCMEAVHRANPCISIPPIIQFFEKTDDLQKVIVGLQELEDSIVVTTTERVLQNTNDEWSRGVEHLRLARLASAKQVVTSTLELARLLLNPLDEAKAVMFGRLGGDTLTSVAVGNDTILLMLKSLVAIGERT